MYLYGRRCLFLLKTKLIVNRSMGDFEDEMDKLLNKIGPGSVQYRPTHGSDSDLVHSALVIYEIPDVVEGDTDE